MSASANSLAACEKGEGWREEGLLATHLVLRYQQTEEAQQLSEFREGDLAHKAVDEGRDERKDGLTGSRHDSVKGEASLRIQPRSSVLPLSQMMMEREERKEAGERTASRIATKLPMTFADARIVSVVAVNTPTHCPCAVGILALRSGKPFATLAAAIMR
jgi:hypothetical protein